MNQPPLPIVDNVFFIDNSTLERYTTCRRSYEYYGLHRRELKEQRAALDYGQLIHSCMQLRSVAEAGGLSAIDKEFDAVEKQQFALIDQHYKAHPVLDDDYRTATYAQDCISQYNRYPPYLAEPFTIARDTDEKPLVEVPFSLELGNIGPVRILWTGRIDRIILWKDKKVNHWDYKTTSMGGDRFFDSFLNDQGQTGYAWAVSKILGYPVTSFVIDALVCRKPTKTGVQFEFQRRKFDLDADRLLEWPINTLRLVEDIFHDYRRGYFPMETAWCIGKYGRCQYLEVCPLPRSARLPVLHGGLYRDVTWSPLNPHNT